MNTTPFVGRRILFHHQHQDYAAVITGVHNATLINCVVFGLHSMAAQIKTSVSYDESATTDQTWHYDDNEP